MPAQSWLGKFYRMLLEELGMRAPCATLHSAKCVWGSIPAPLSAINFLFLKQL